MNIVDELKQNFKKGNNLIRLIFINVGVFLIVSLINLVYWLGTRSDINFSFLIFPSDIHLFLFKPWTIITYMFMHADIWHILFNLLFFYWFGQIFLQYLDQKKLLTVYLLGGFSGAIFYSLVYSIFPAFELENHLGSSLLGASAAIMAVTIAITTIVPNFSVNMIFIGPVKLKYIALFVIALDLISIQTSNAGGHISHIGGALFGYIYGIRYLKGHDFTIGFTKFLDGFLSLFKPRKRMKVTYKKPVDDYEYNRSKVEEQKEIDRILDKIAKGGYESLSKNEKDFLFKSSK